MVELRGSWVTSAAQRLGLQRIPKLPPHVSSARGTETALGVACCEPAPGGSAARDEAACQGENGEPNALRVALCDQSLVLRGVPQVPLFAIITP